MIKRIAILAVMAALVLSAAIATQGTGTAEAAKRPVGVIESFGSTWS